jgi:hypothetical protein
MDFARCKLHVSLGLQLQWLTLSTPLSSVMEPLWKEWRMLLWRGVLVVKVVLTTGLLGDHGRSM